MQLRPPFTSSLLPSFSRGLFRTPVHPSASFRVLVPTTSPQPKTTTPNPHSPRHTLTLHPDPLKYRPASPPATPPQAIPSTAIVVAGTHPLTLQQLTRPVGVAFRPRPTGHVKLSRFAPFCPSSPHDYLHHTNPPNPPIRTAFSTVLQLRRQPPPYFFHRPLPAQKHIIKWPYFLRHISGIPPASLTPNTSCALSLHSC